MTQRGLFIAGTSTEVGKTRVAAMIARELASAGHRVGVYKPVASGCRYDHGQLVADDAVQLWHAAGQPHDLEHVCPQRFLAAVAPPQAARLERRQVDEDALRSGVAYWRERSDVVLVEGAGGLMSPLGESIYNIDLAAAMGYPLVIVAANELGVLNATLQTIITARAQAPALPIAGIVLNQAQRRDDDASLESNAAELQARCPAPMLASVGYGDGAFDGSVDWFRLASGGIDDFTIDE